MSEHFIKEIEIKDYKLFKDFKAEGFGRVNLIGGKNNVGKTAFMEACFLSEKVISFDRVSANLLYLSNIRYNLCSTIIVGKNFKKLLDNYKKIEISSNLNNLSFEFITDKLTYEYVLNNKKENISNFLKENMEFIIPLFINFLPSSNINNQFLFEEFDKIKELRLRNELNNELYSFDSNIVEFEVIDNRPQVYLNNLGKFIEISSLGHGFKRYLSLIMLILINSNSVIYLDEIENGIHYTNFDKLWEIILTLSKEQNVQVFATTHSKECIESFNRVQKKLEDKDTYYFEMAKNIKTNKIFMTRIDSEQLEYGLAHNERIRGE